MARDLKHSNILTYCAGKLSCFTQNRAFLYWVSEVIRFSFGLRFYAKRFKKLCHSDPK